MPFAEKLTVSLTILITGFVVVFAVLLLLILLISLYGKIVSSMLTKKTKNTVETPKTEISPTVTAVEEEIPEEDDLEIIAVISAAVYAVYGEKAVKIRSVKKVPQSRPVWSTAGIMENTRPF